MSSETLEFNIPFIGRYSEVGTCCSESGSPGLADGYRVECQCGHSKKVRLRSHFNLACAEIVDILYLQVVLQASSGGSLFCLSCDLFWEEIQGDSCWAAARKDPQYDPAFPYPNIL